MVERHRDPITGQFTGGTLTSEEAAELARKRAEAVHGERVRPSELLREMGYNEHNPAPARIKILARQACKDTGSPVTALRALIDAVTAGSQAPDLKPAQGSICPTCNQLVDDLSGEVLLQLLDLAQQPGVLEGEKGISTQQEQPPDRPRTATARQEAQP